MLSPFSLHDALPIYQGLMPVGAMIASLQYAMQILFAVFMVTAMFVMLPRASASAARINEVLAIAPEIVDPPHPKPRPEEHTSELQSLRHLVCRLLLERFRHLHALPFFPTRRSSDLSGPDAGRRDDRVAAVRDADPLRGVHGDRDVRDAAARFGVGGANQRSPRHRAGDRRSAAPQAETGRAHV